MNKVIWIRTLYALHPTICFLEIAAVLLVFPDHPSIDQFIQIAHQKEQLRLEKRTVVFNPAAYDQIQLIGQLLQR